MVYSLAQDPPTPPGFLKMQKTLTQLTDITGPLHPLLFAVHFLVVSVLANNAQAVMLFCSSPFPQT